MHGLFMGMHGDELGWIEKAIFRFILDGQARSSFTRDLKSQVQIAQMSPQARQGYMTWKRLQAEAQRLGMERGIAEGEHNARLEAARRFLQMGLSVEQIAEGVGLSATEIQQLS